MPFQKKLFPKRVPYRIVSVLKNDGPVKVYKALQGATFFQQEVILKVFQDKSDLFKKEWESLKQASSSACVKLLGVEFFKGHPALVLESIKGVTLLELIRRYALSREEISHLMSRTYRGLKSLTHQGLFHGDLSLSNILVTEKGEIQFIDFGKGNRGNRGTMPFVAPEILKGGGHGLSSDLFSLGVIEFLLENPHKLNSLKNKSQEYFLSRSSLLQEDPEKRHLKKQKETVTPSSLKTKVKEILLFKETSWQTEDLSPPTVTTTFDFKKSIVFACAWLFLWIAANNIPSVHKSVATEGFLKIHTNQWFHVTLNSLRGYTPIEAPLSSGHYKLLWKSQEKKGEKLLYIPPGKTLVLNDRDFL